MLKFLKALILIIIFLVGVALIVLPFVYSMPDRTNAADKMMKAFDPIVNTDHATLLQGDVATLQAMAEDTKTLLPALGDQLGMTEAQLNDMLAEDYPGLAAGMQKMEEMLGRLSGDTQVITDQVDNFASAKKLPVKMTPWLFIGLGAAIVVLLLLRLLLWRPRKKDKEEKKEEPAAPAAPAA
jgi:preprotein translocase subunit YajC